MQSRIRFTSLRLRLVVVFGLVALTAAVSASGIAYWLNREAVQTRAQDAALNDFEREMQSHVSTLRPNPTQDQLRIAARKMADGGERSSVLLLAEGADGRTVSGSSTDNALTGFSLDDAGCPSRRPSTNGRSSRRETGTRTTCTGSGSSTATPRIWWAARR